jgi:RecB family exonuclease
MILPQAIDVVAMPEYFSPSQIGGMDFCLLRAILASTEVKVPHLLLHPAAELGTVFHRLLEMSIRGQLPVSEGVAEQVVRGALESLLTEATDRLREDVAKCHYADLAGTVTPLEWRRRVRTVVDTAIRMARFQALPAPAPRGSLHYPDLPGTGPWTEVGIQVPKLRLKGRMDVVERSGKKVVVRDLKTGRVTDDEGEILPLIISQMTLYGIMLASFDHGGISLVVDSAEEIHIPFGPAKIRKAEAEWDEFLGKIPLKGAECRAEKIAKVAEDCPKCSNRHVCRAYLAAAPKKWAETPEYRIPYDTWGTVLKVLRNGPDNSAVILEDAAGRLVKVTGLRDSNVAGVEAGQMIWLFNLNTSDRSAFRNGKWHHPVNFHEIPEGLVDRRAWNLDVYRKG